MMFDVRTQPPVPGMPSPADAPPTVTAGSPSRRSVLLGGAGIGVAGALYGAGRSAAAPAAPPRPRSHDVFAHGVASGDPLPDRVILWTRVSPTPAATPGSGVGAPVQVTWRIGTDSALRSVVASGTTTTGPERDFTVKIDATGLSPDTRYWYEFALTSAGTTHRSPIGATRTAPPADADVSRVRFGVVSCANWEAGYFGAYRHLLGRRDLSAIVHLGDYYYEYKTGEYTGKGHAIRVHAPRNEARTLRDYRIRHAQYKTDTDLAALHRALPWICTWDDHESADNSWLGGAENHSPSEGSWAARKAAAERAYYEWMPVRPPADAGGLHLYRRLRFGNLLDLSMLDLRTYRDREVSVLSRKIDDKARSITGKAQLKWLTDGLTGSTATWRIVGNPVMITPVLLPPLDRATTGAITDVLGIPEGGIPYNADQWDGYTADRARLLRTIRDKKISNVVFITGDIHTSWACDVPVDAARYRSTGAVATELVVPSVTASNIDEMIKVPEHTVSNAIPPAITALNPHIKWTDLDAHGYGVLTVTKAAVQMDWYFLRDKTQPRTGEYHGRSFRVRSGSNRVIPVVNPIP